MRGSGNGVFWIEFLRNVKRTDKKMAGGEGELLPIPMAFSDGRVIEQGGSHDRGVLETVTNQGDRGFTVIGFAQKKRTRGRTLM